MLARVSQEKREKDFLASYAMKSEKSQGRVFPEEEHPYRTVFQRDKDRIIYSTAFRRLEYKTQVFVNHEGDYYRTRLTHTLEVAQISRTIARALRLNEDLVETIALAHDLGHTPFGHSGEKVMNELMKDYGGFDHNSHGLRVVDLLEERYPNFPGLNLSKEVRRGIICHSTPFDKIRTGYSENVDGPWLLEIQVVDVSDEIAYDNHDLDDGLKSGLLCYEDLEGVEIWDKAAREAEQLCPDGTESIRRSLIIRNLINDQVSNLIENTIKNIKNNSIVTVEDLVSNKVKIVDFDDDMNKKRDHLKKRLNEKLYKHYRVVRMSNKASRFLRRLFEIFVENTEQLPPKDFKKINERGKYQVICDYIAGMTDRFALDQYKKFFEPFERV